MKLIVEDISNLFQKSCSFSNAKESLVSVQTDSRLVKEGDLFVAIPGENFDGHDFLENALQKKAALCLTQKPTSLDRTLVCEDVIEGLGKIANFYRQKFKGKVIAITGSNGKTTTKELLKHVLEAQGKTQATKGNYNNHIGLPLTLLSFATDYDFSIVEMGMSAAGEIRDLCKIAHPEYGLITCVGPAHIEAFDGKIEGVAKAKGELFEYLTAENVAIVNQDDPFVSKLPTKAKTITYGFNESADARASDLTIKDECSHFTIHWQNKTYKAILPLVGKHFVQNSLGVFALAMSLSLDPQKITDSFSSFQSYSGRGVFSKIGQWDIIDDTYNANPSSVAAAFETLILKYPNHQKVAVLGDMLGLGKDAKAWHQKIGALAKEKGISKLYAYGKNAQYYLDGFGTAKDSYHFGSHDDLALKLISDLKTKEPVALLCKGSRAMKMENVLEILKKNKELV